ncbi:MAG: GIY-YIG nuclease family protein [Flavobacterium sp.]|jgi:predicted GIY-YIG superfamily endonuclease
MIKIYILQLENDKFYVGQSKDTEYRLKLHVKGKLSSEWTKLNRPIGFIKIIETDFTETSSAMQLENSITIDCMKKYGWRNVRGGDYCTLDEDKLRFLLSVNSDLGTELLPIKNPKNFNVNKNGEFLFVLKLQDENFYVGRTKNIKLAILNEFNCLGSEWTKIHKPIELFSLIDITILETNKIRNMHNSVVINYMKKYGFQKIRGGDFFKVDIRNHKNKVLNYTDIFKNTTQTR